MQYYTTQENWQAWFNSLPWNKRLRQKAFSRLNRITDVLCQYDWMPEFVFSENIERTICTVFRAHMWEVLYAGYVHKDKEGCLYCGKERSLLHD